MTNRIILSTANIRHLPHDNITEIALLGRSNTGKSSTINILSNQKLAKTGKIPGCTKLINSFEIPILKIRLLDFPGYGYPSNIKKTKKSWGKNIINQYLNNRKNLIGVILVIDIRRSINTIDQTIIQQNNINNIPTLLLLNKSDKLTKYAISIQLQQIKKTIDTKKNTKILIFSSLNTKAKDIHILRNTINNWRNHPSSITK